MNTVNNLQVNTKANCLRKKRALKLVAGFAVVAVLAAVPIVSVAHNDYVINQQENAIVAYYGDESIESKIIDYINVSDELNKLNLRSFTVDDSLYEKYNISNELKSPEEITKYIEQFKSVNSYISSKDITKQIQNIDIVLNLKAQEKLVNSYIYNVGYSVANENITSATKKYTAEVFGIEDPSNIYFNYHTDNGTNETNTMIINQVTNKYGLRDDESYNFDNTFEKKEEKQINKGVISMVQTDTSSDKIETDNNKYNYERNSIIRKALANSANLENQVEDYDLYNEKLANKMK